MSQNHEYCIVHEIDHLMEKGFTCYIEETLWLDGKKLIVDIYATKGNEVAIIEVGTLSKIHGERLNLLRQLKPYAKIIHVQQWKNYGLSESYLFREWLRLRQEEYYIKSGRAKLDVEEMGKSLE